ncbi:MAG: hypothetical protein CSB06_01130 [Bacteroidia bacterium]|nr:MAG: hypothetical protein CSB06_01130 [Bacteroidia bacterium]
MRKIKYISQIVHMGVLPLVFLMYANSIANKHMHILPDGEIIIHAHPFLSSFSSDTKTGRNSHGHDQNDLIRLNFLGNPGELQIILYLPILYFFTLRYCKIKTRNFFFIQRTCSSEPHNKAPTAFLLK